MPRPPAARNMPSLPKIVDYWSTEQHSDVFPNLAARALGWGEPFCFRCGWLSPLPAKAINGTEAKPTNPWKYARGWLQRAHLAEKFTGGPDTVDNLVPMCSLCHRQMPEAIASREVAIAWINSWASASRNILWQGATDALWGGEKFEAFPGTGNFLLLRMQIDEYERDARAQAKAFAATAA